jgi:hypothetical protein
MLELGKGTWPPDLTVKGAFHVRMALRALDTAAELSGVMMHVGVRSSWRLDQYSFSWSKPGKLGK